MGAGRPPGAGGGTAVKAPGVPGTGVRVHAAPAASRVAASTTATSEQAGRVGRIGRLMTTRATSCLQRNGAVPAEANQTSQGNAGATPAVRLSRPRLAARLSGPPTRGVSMGSERVDAGLLFTRLALGGVLFAHGAQKLFGWFGGHG